MLIPFPPFESKAAKWLLGGLAALMVLWAGLAAHSCWGTRKADQAVKAAGQEQLQGTADAARGGVHDQVVEHQVSVVSKADETVAKARAIRDRLRRPTAAPPAREEPTPAGEPTPEPAPAREAPEAELARLRTLTGAQDQLIDALTRANAEKDQLIVSLTAARDDYRSALKHETERARLLEIAQEARQAAGASDRNRGRIEGALLMLLLKSVL